MEFWGVEVKAGQPLKVNPEVGRVIHISQAAVGDGKKEKGSDLIPLRLKINNENFVVGSLSADSFPQVTFDLVLEKEFELSHDWKNGSVYFCGYSADNPYAQDEDEFSDSEDEDIPLGITGNGKIESKGVEAMPAASKGKAAKPESSAKPKGTVMDLKKEEVSDESDEDESDDDEDLMDDSDEIGDSEDEDDSEDEANDEDEETPKKADPSKKRQAESAKKTPNANKKAKLETPQKTDGKKGSGHAATPHPSKQQRDGKTPANSNKSKDQTPKSVGKVTCNSCSKTFNSENALQSHTKAKHAGK